MRVLQAFSVFALFLVGCSSPKSIYYSLSSPPISVPVLALNQTRVMVGPVSLPAAVDRPQIVVWGEGNEIGIYEYHRWSSPLRSEVGEVISANLARELNISNVWTFSESTQTNFDYQVFIDIQKLENKLGDSVLVDVLWTIKPTLGGNKALNRVTAENALGGDKTKTMMGRSLVREPISNPGIEALVSAQSRAFSRVGFEIAQAMKIQ